VFFPALDIYESFSVPTIHNVIQFRDVCNFCFKYLHSLKQDVHNYAECWTQRFIMSTDEILIWRWIMIFVSQWDKIRIGTKIASTVFIKGNIICNAYYTYENFNLILTSFWSVCHNYILLLRIKQTICL
jgi:hypothetical protein